jgi:hypothetical protein
MRLLFVQLRVFTRDFSELELRDIDLRALEAQLLERPDGGRIIRGTGGLRKTRFAPPSTHRGKRGAARVCYAWFPELDAIYLFAIYTKNQKDNLTAAEKNNYRRVIEAFRRQAKDRHGAEHEKKRPS